MFIKQTKDKSAPSAPIYRAGQRLPIMAAKQLLNSPQHQFYFQQLARLTELPTDYFELCYEDFVKKFAEFVQVLPRENNGPLMGLLNDSLLRAINTLHLLTIEYSDATPLERFAIFSAALLHDVSYVVLNQKIFITDEQGATIAEWRPFTQSLPESFAEQTYKILPLAANYQRLNQGVMLLLVRQIMPEIAFFWIADDFRLFADWLAALMDDAAGSGRLVHVMQLYKREPHVWFEALPIINIVQEDSPATQLADEFYAWLKQMLENNQLKVNSADAYVHVLPDGVFIDKGIFRDFVESFVNIPANMFVVHQQFGNLFGLTKLSGQDYRIAQLFSDFPDAARVTSGFMGPIKAAQNAQREGFLIRDPALFFMKGDVPPATNHLKLPATEVAPERLPSISKNVSLQPKKTT